MRIWQRMLVAGLLLQAAMGLRAGTVATIQVKGPIGPATASYIARAIDVAANEQAVCLVLQLDTPGGLLDSTKEIVDTFYSAPIPVVVHVAPSGANAGSAGVFITIPYMLGELPGPLALAGWLVAGLLILADGLVWSELGAALPGSGGSYLYLLESYGPRRWGRLMAFLFIWQFMLSGPLELASGLIAMDTFSQSLSPQWAEFNRAWTARLMLWPAQELAHGRHDDRHADAVIRVEQVPLAGLDDEALAALDRERGLALDAAELRAIQAHFDALGRAPTDVEIEMSLGNTRPRWKATRPPASPANMPDSTKAAH